MEIKLEIESNRIKATQKVLETQKKENTHGGNNTEKKP